MFGFNMNRILLIAGMRLGIPGALEMMEPPMMPRRSGPRRGSIIARSTYFPPEKRNGKQECARRRRQIEAGSLRVENGLMWSHEEKERLLRAAAKEAWNSVPHQAATGG